LKPETPAGHFSDQLILVTSDGAAQQIPLEVQALIAARITVTPPQLALGDVRQGEPITRQIVVKGKSPFRIASVSCPNHAFQFKADDAEKSLHVVSVTFRGAKLGKVQEKIQIRTEDGKQIAASLVAYANVVPGETADSEPASDSTLDQAEGESTAPQSDSVAADR
jgi:hypothetical protein